VEQQVNYTTGRRFMWMKQLCAINPPVGQPDRLTRWVDEAVIIIRPALRYHPFTIYTWILALLMEKIFEVTPTSPKALTCWISQILNIHFTCVEYLWRVESEIRILEEIGLERELMGKVARMKLQYFGHATRGSAGNLALTVLEGSIDGLCHQGAVEKKDNRLVICCHQPSSTMVD